MTTFRPVVVAFLYDLLDRLLLVHRASMLPDAVISILTCLVQRQIVVGGSLSTRMEFQSAKAREIQTQPHFQTLIPTLPKPMQSEALPRGLSGEPISRFKIPCLPLKNFSLVFKKSIECGLMELRKRKRRLQAVVGMRRSMSKCCITCATWELLALIWTCETSKPFLQR